MESFKITMFFTREKLIDLLVDENNPFNKDDYEMWDDNKIIQEAGEEGYLQGVNKNKIYCFTDDGKIIIQKTLEDF